MKKIEHYHNHTYLLQHISQLLAALQLLTSQASAASLLVPAALKAVVFGMLSNPFKTTNK